MALFERIREERERLGFSQADFAALAGASRKSQIRWEQVGGGSPDAPALAAWAQVGADILYIVAGARSAEGLSRDEIELLERYRAAPLAVKAAAVAALAAGTGQATKYAVDFGGASIGQVVQGDGGYVSHGDVNVGGRKKKKQ